MEERILFLVRHCEADGQDSQSSLTEIGRVQSERLSDFFSNFKIDKICSSPFVRAVQTAEPLSRRIGLEIELDERLSERRLSTKNLPDWFDKLKVTFEDLDLSLEGGESSREATKRIVDAVDDVLQRSNERTVLITHGNILSLLINHFNPDFGFEEWQSLSNPDVYLLKRSNGTYHFKRIWNEAL